MHATQDRLFYWVSHQPGSVGLLILAIGFLYGFHGFRLYRPLLSLTCAALGAVLGFVVAELTGLEALPACGAGVLVLVVLSIRAPRAAAAIASGLTWAVFGAYLATQLGMRGWWPTFAAASAGCLGVVFMLLCERTMRVILTTLQGATLLVIGGAGASSSFLPSFGHTFCSWASSFSLLVPIVITVFFVTAYSYQALHSRGDMRSGI